MENAANSKQTVVKTEPKPPKKISQEVSYTKPYNLPKSAFKTDFIPIC